MLPWIFSLGIALAGEIPAQTLAPGAVSLPTGLVVSAPFPEGTEFMISCDYAPCTPAHKGTEDAGGINDHYALDLIRNQRGNGRGELITTALPGEVVYAGWGQKGRSIYGRLVMVRHPLPDGGALVSFYAHLSRLLVKVGDILPAKAPIGHMGGSAWGKDDKLAPHLHFALHLNPRVHGGPAGGQAVFPEPLDGNTGLHKEQILTAGDGVREAIYLVVDDESAGFQLLATGTDPTVHRVQPSEREQYIYGTAETWTGPEGYGPESRFRSLPTTTAADADTSLASWEAVVPRGGAWEAQIFVPSSPGATASHAEYRLEAPDKTLSCTIDQAASAGWMRCASPLPAATGQTLRVRLQAGGRSAQDQRIGIDAVRFVWRGPSPSY